MKALMKLGTRFGRLTVAGTRSSKDEGIIAICVCDCGRKRFVRAVELRRTRHPTKSCSGKHPCEICGKVIGPQGEWSHLRLHRAEGAPK